MIALLNLIEAKKRLKESIITIEMMGDCGNDMLEAQRDMIDLEVKYYKDEVMLYPLYILGITCTSGLLYILYKLL